MADVRKPLFANAQDYVEVQNNNIVDNLRRNREAYILLPSLYQRAFILTYETGEVPFFPNRVAPRGLDE